MTKKCNECNKVLIGRQKRWCSHICEVKNWQKRNTEKYNQYKKNYIINNREKRLESIKKYDNSDKGINNRKVWVEKNRERLNELSRIRSYKYKDRLKSQCCKRRAIIKNLDKHFTKKEWIYLKDKYGNKCLSCGKKDGEILLTPDHVVPLSKGGVNTIDNIQPLCRTCNYKKNNKKIIDYRLLV